MRRFTVTEDHLKLLRRMNVSWNECEYGAPCIDPKRPYGNSDVVGDIAKILGIELVPTDDEETHWPPGTTKLAETIHSQLQDVLQIVLSAGVFELGDYIADDYNQNWKKAP